MNSNNLLRNMIVAVIILGANAVLAEDDSQEERCISLMRIKSVDILDNQRIVFRMMGGKNYLNVLPHRCPGLSRNKPLMYRTSLSVLCDLDIITVLDTGGGGFRPLGSCGLGRFSPMLDSNIDTIKGELKVPD